MSNNSLLIKNANIVDGTGTEAFIGDVLVEDGVCIDYTEELKLVRGNEIKYTILKNGTDTLKLGLRATGENINHCGTFSYYFDDDNKLFRSYKECDSFYPESYTLSFYEADQSIDVLCPNL